MARISTTDLIVNPDGSIFHLGLRPEHVADVIVAVGDPARVDAISRRFDKIEYRGQKREFVTHTGVYKGQRLTAISTGIGTDNVEIVFQELDALVNVDLEKREPKSQHRSLQIIRVGTSGALQPEIPVGSLLVSDFGVGFDNLMTFYPLEESKEESTFAGSLQRHSGLPFRPYVARGSSSLRDKFRHLPVGNTVTCPGFYAPQGRHVRVPIRFTRLLDSLGSYRSGNFRLTNFEMETAAYFAMGRMMGHETASLSVILANRVTNEWAPDPGKSVEELITVVLDGI